MNKRQILVLLLLAITSHLVFSAEEILQEIRVRDGDTLWSIANYYLKDPRAWPEILKYNKLPSSDPNIVLPGMKLKVPVRIVKESLRPAYIVYVQNDVNFRKKNTVEWQKASQNIELFNEDSLRTMVKSLANVRFITGEIVKLSENSLIILRPEKAREEVQLFSGAVRASRAKILTEGAVIEPKIEAKSANPDFKTRVKDDKTTLVEVYEGIVDVSAEGKTVTITKGFGTEVKFLSQPSMPRMLPPEPEIDSLSGRNRFSGTDSLNLDFSKDKNSKVLSDLKIKQCKIQIAPDEAFTNVLIEEIKSVMTITNFELQKYNLRDGKYYFRMAYIDEFGFESKFTSPQTFVIDKTQPKMEITKPLENEKTAENFIYVEGRTEPNAYLKVNDKVLASDKEGKFSTKIPLVPGRNKVYIVSNDKAGNQAQAERNVYFVTQAAPEKDTTTTKILFFKAPKWIETQAGVIIGTIAVIVIAGVLINIMLP